MDINDLFQRLSYGELSNLAIGGEGSGTILAGKEPKLVGYTNEGLLRLFSRFILKEDNLLIELVSGVTQYILKEEYAEHAGAASGVTYHYIKDSEEAPFLDDVIKILGVYDTNLENDYPDAFPLNDLEHNKSLFTPQPHILQVPRPVENTVLSVLYQARHPKLSHEELDTVINIPFFLEGALQSFVASEVYSHMNGQDNTAKAAEFMLKYESVCQEVEERDLVSSSIASMQYKFNDRGFV